MKNRILNRTIKLTWVILLAMFAFVACDPDEEEDVDPITTITVEDGYYVKGAGTALTEFDSKGQMKATKNEATGEERSQLLELYVAVKGGTDGFNIIKVSGSDQVVCGPGTDFALVDAANLDAEEPKDGLWKGSYAASATAFTVTELSICRYKTKGNDQ